MNYEYGYNNRLYLHIIYEENLRQFVIAPIYLNRRHVRNSRLWASDDNLLRRQSTVDDEQREIDNRRFPRTILQQMSTVKPKSSLFPAEKSSIYRRFCTGVYTKPFLKKSSFFPVAESRQNTTHQKNYRYKYK